MFIKKRVQTTVRPISGVWLPYESQLHPLPASESQQGALECLSSSEIDDNNRIYLFEL